MVLKAKSNINPIEEEEKGGKEKEMV